jgi:hypothetical protein
MKKSAPAADPDALDEAALNVSWFSMFLRR